MLAARFGMFSHLWIDMAQRLGLKVDVLDAEWGEGAPVERYQEALAADQGHEIKAVLFTHNETATGVTSDVAGMRKALNDAKHPALLMVDGVSSIGSIDFRMDEWGVDCAVTGSQKGLMLPAGLGILAVSPKAAALYDSAKLPRVFFDLGDMKKANATGYFPYTPSLPLLYGLRESLAMLFEEGLDNVFARHHRLAEGTRAAIKAWGLELCARAAQVALRHGQRDHGAGRRQRGAGHRYRVPAVQSGPGRRARADGRQAVPNRPPRRPERMHAARRHRRRGDGDARRGHQAQAGQRRRRGGGILARHGEAAREARAAAARARRPARGRRAEGEGDRRRRAMSHTRVEPARQRLQRSELAVPGSNPGMFVKALDGEADYIFLDLEDAVAPGDKEQARKNVIQGLLQHDWHGRGKTISVRINGIDTHYMYRDVVDVVEQAGHRLDTILIPKVGVPADVYLVDALLTQIEEAKGIPHRIGIDVLIETALGMANVEAIAQSSRRLEAMHFGVADYAASCRARTVVIGGLNPDYPGDQWHAALSRMIVACRAYGLRPIDGPFGDFKDPDGYRLAAKRGAALGIEGKWAIHPSQIALANEVFSPPPAEVERAQRILTALDEAAREGRGAAQLDGRMIDAASARMAQNVVNMAKAIDGRGGAPAVARA